jgi:hypothetical protein
MRQSRFRLCIVAAMLGVRAFGVPPARLGRGPCASLAARELDRFARQPTLDSREGGQQLAACVFGGGRGENGLRVLEPGVLAERHIAKAEQSEDADAGFQTAATEYSKHRSIVGRVDRFGEIVDEFREPSGPMREVRAAKQREARVVPERLADGARAWRVLARRH